MNIDLPNPLPVVWVYDDTQAFEGSKKLTLATSGSARIWIITGAAPGAEGAVIISYAAIATNGSVPDCQAQDVTTEAEYSFGFPTPDWPDITHTNVTYNRLAQTVEVSWKTMGNLHPNSNYGINIYCPIKLTGPGNPAQ
jgi:hypothetical protein